jgi:predicted nuclease of predicted toxin-antitoxin system
MRLLANENFPLAAVRALREAGHEVAWIREVDAGSSDDAVLARAVREERVLLTFDKDFGALVFHRGRGASRGVVLFRMPLVPPASLALQIVNAIAARPTWEGYFAVVEPGRARLRPLP